MVFREMRRKKQALSQQEIAQILQQETSGVLALIGDEVYPYAVPISYVYDGEKLYFHSAKSGHKLDAIQQNAKASFCVVAKDTVVPEEYTTYFQSVIVFGQIRLIQDERAKIAAIEKLAGKYAPEATTMELEQEINREWNPLCLLEMTIDHVTEKEAIELCGKNSKHHKHSHTLMH